jgi:hypothetical protein
MPRRQRDTGGFPQVRETGMSGLARDTGEFGAARDAGGFRQPRDTGGFRQPRDTGGFGGVRRADDFEGARALDPVRDPGDPRRGRDSGELRSARDSGELRSARDSGELRSARHSGEFQAARDSGEFRAARDSGEFRGARDSGEFGAARGAGQQRPPLTLRYTPTVGTSGPMRPVPPPAEFDEPWQSGPRYRSGPPPPARQSMHELPAPPRSRREPRVSQYDRDDRDWRAPGEGRDRRDDRDWRAPGEGRDRREGGDWRDRLPGRGAWAGQRGQGAAPRHPADHDADPGRATRLARDVAAAMRSRGWVTGLAMPILAAVAVGIAVVVIAGANNGNTGPAPTSLAAGFPPARPAAADFTDTPALAGRGIQAPLSQVATSGATIVAVGAQSGGRIDRARFYVSTDNGQTWQLAAVRGDPPPGDAATLVAGGPRGWAAVGPSATWTSQNGRDWLPGPRLPQLAGDEITTLTATGSGFLAAGTNVPGGDAAKASPVVWLSANGTTWQRLGVTQLGLTAGDGRVLGITGAAANGGVTVMTGTVAGATTGSGMWRSADGGTSWTLVTLLSGGGANATIDGVAPLRGGFVAVRPASAGGTADAAVYTSANGTSWQQSATLNTADGSPLTLGLVSGGPNGAVVTGQADGLGIAFLSPDGVTWTGTDPVGTAASEQIAGVALTATGQAVLSGATEGNAAEQQPVLTMIGTQAGPRQIAIASIPGAVTAQVAVNAIAASGTTQVAAGSADGFPALWVSADGGSTWARGAGATPATASRAGDEQLTGVAHGAAGWLAVGGPVTAPAQRPVVIGSADGRTWTELDGAAAFTGSAPGQVVTAAAAAGPAGYVIVGHEPAGGRTVAAAWYAPGLTGWQRAASALPGTGQSQMNAVTATGATGATGRGFVAVGSAGTRPAAWVSATGRTWSLASVPLPAGAASAQLQYVAASGKAIAAAGTEVTAAGRPLPFAAVSTDGGVAWTLAALPAPSSAGRAAANLTVTALAAAGGGFTATGTYGTPGTQDVAIWTLAAAAAPGTAWTAAAPAGMGLSGPGTQAITALTGAGSTLTGVGFTATPAAEQPTIWQSPVRS